ncbi:protein of unknown function [Taphrina deformans PYCC 5710]|uniref:Uncharacterized protein n=1 Tax=Taphrina deformans (strain PYCC 5710 / ATCC 11124 / CBS 356.35 / IMI 108563 / JCM 9778 / NBRC 8474) TaxID=1097556 RepID=R4XDR9_TAPDE|nr:protein of unknown function [Taphrina deformans PYCC 5710]|eukprot:CCG83772.1 protein of unknown function [Taphrina deformans PYCC 5710]
MSAMTLPSQSVPNVLHNAHLTSHLHESVPTYEASPNDPRANSYRIFCHKNTYELICDNTGESYRFTDLEESSKSSKEIPKSMDIMHQASVGASATRLAQISGITKKKLKLTKRDPVVNLHSSHGKIPLTLFRGNYCGFKHPTQKIEYYWQLRNQADTRRETTQFSIRDAVFRRTVAGELSTITSMYLPNDKAQSVHDSLSIAHESRDDRSVESTPAYDQHLGRLLVRSDLQDFDKDMTVISFIAVLIRVIEAEKKTPFANGFIRALTIGAV